MKEVVKLSPAVKSYIWGGSYFQKYSKGNGEDIISELWELSVRDDSSMIVSGENKGKYLKDIISKEDLGPNSGKLPYFPLLIKLIDAKDNLSVQVHPSNEYALKNENSFGKTEMWYILSADEGAGLYIGLNKDYSQNEIKEKLENGTLLEALNFYPVKPGDAYLIKSGTIHAIGKGVRIMEIQQNSDLTYRLYDYGRVGKDGKPRELHIEKALEVIDYKKYQNEEPKGSLIFDTKYFKVEKKEVNGSLKISANRGSFVSFTFISGSGKVNNIDYKIYDTFFLPSGKECEIKGDGVLILSRI